MNRFLSLLLSFWLVLSFVAVVAVWASGDDKSIVVVENRAVGKYIPSSIPLYPVLAHARAAETFDLAGVRAKSQRTQDGYELRVYFPWPTLNLSAKKLPAGLRINVLINDWLSGKGRRAVQWTKGIGATKAPARLPTC